MFSLKGTQRVFYLFLSCVFTHSGHVYYLQSNDPLIYSGLASPVPLDRLGASVSVSGFSHLSISVDAYPNSHPGFRNPSVGLPLCVGGELILYYVSTAAIFFVLRRIFLILFDSCF